MNILLEKTTKLAISLTKKGHAEQLVELLEDDLVTVDTEADIPCNLVRKFPDQRPRLSEDSENEDEYDVTAKSEPYTSKPQMCSCVSSSKKEQGKTAPKQKPKREIFTHHNGTLLEIAAAYGQVDVMKVLLDRGADPYAMHDGTTALLQALLHWCHTHTLQSWNACFRYKKAVLLLLEHIDVEKYCGLWERCEVTNIHHKMKFHPVNYTCSLDFSAGLETLLKKGFRVPDGEESALSRVLSQFSTNAPRKFSFVTHQTLECIDLLAQYGHNFKVAFKVDPQLSQYLRGAFTHIIVNNPRPKGLSCLMELGADPTVTVNKIPYLVEALDFHRCRDSRPIYARYGRGGFRGRRMRGRGGMKGNTPQRCKCKVIDVANILIGANCGINLPKDLRGYRPSALTLALMRFTSLVLPLLKAGATVNEDANSDSSENQTPGPFHGSTGIHYGPDGRLINNDVELAEEYLEGDLRQQFLSFVNNEDGIKLSLKFQCKLFIRNHLGICTYGKLMKLGLPMPLVSYLMLNG